MLWIVIAASDLDDYLVGAQAEAIRTAALGVGQSDRFARVMPDVAARIRNEIQACSGNLVSATPNAIPPELKTIACQLIIEAMQAALPGLELTENQGNLIRDGRRYLERIAKCEIAVSEPDDPLEPTEVQRNSPMTVVTSSTRHFTRSAQDGL
jgi:hypothetical protein